MDNNRPFLIILIILVLSVGAYVYYKKNYVPKFQWYENYGKNNDQPYGMSIFYSAVSESEQEATIMNRYAFDLLDTNAQNMNFISIDHSIDIDSTMASQLLAFAERGNHVLIASNYGPFEILKYFIPVGTYIQHYRAVHDTTVRLTFHDNKSPNNSELKFSYQFYKKKSDYYWQSYRTAYFNTTLSANGFEAYSHINDTAVNSFIVKHGKGKIIVHTNPILFSNYFMCTKQGLVHANKFLSLLHKGHTFWYDEDYYSNLGFKRSGRGPLKLLFSHPYLKWGWYLFLLNILLYLLFRSKREQRIIPLLPVNSNASIEYTKAIGTLYFRTNRHDHLVNELYHIFMAEIRNRYNLRTDIPEPKLIEQVSQRSGVDPEKVKYLFRQFKLLRDRPDVELTELTELYNRLEEFNKKRK